MRPYASLSALFLMLFRCNSDEVPDAQKEAWEEMLKDDMNGAKQKYNYDDSLPLCPMDGNSDSGCTHCNTIRYDDMKLVAGIRNGVRRGMSTAASLTGEEPQFLYDISKCCEHHYTAWKQQKSLCKMDSVFCPHELRHGEWRWYDWLRVGLVDLFTFGQAGDAVAPTRYYFKEDPCTNESMSDLPDPYVPLSGRPGYRVTLPAGATTLPPSWDGSCSGDPNEPRCSADNECKCCFTESHNTRCWELIRAKPDPT